jgi:hypothetical protein
VRTAHGLLPNPAPATVRLLRDVPTYGRATTVELTTPTGAALLAALSTSFGPMPAMVVSASGFGGGAGELDELPNCTQVIIGRRDGQADIGPGQPALLVETNLDDVTGEQLGHAVSAALEAGAFDAWITAVTTDVAHLDSLRHVIAASTGTFGVRATPAERWPAARTIDEVTIDGKVVRMKVGSGRAKPEFDDVVSIATASGLGVHEVASRAEEAWRLARRRAPTEPHTGEDR